MSRSPVATRVNASGEGLAPARAGLVDVGDGDTDAEALRWGLAADGALASVVAHPPNKTATRKARTPHVRARDPVSASVCPTGPAGLAPARGPVPSSDPLA